MHTLRRNQLSAEAYTDLFTQAETYSPPSKNIPVIWSLRPLDIRRLQIKGMGNASVRMSVTTLKEARIIAGALKSIQVALIVVSQKPCTG